MAAAGEGGGNGTTATNPGRYLGGRIGFAAGPFDVAGAYAQQRFTGTPGNINRAGTTDNQKTWNIGGTYDFGVAKILGYFDRDTVDNLRENRFSISGVVPLGQGEIHVGYDRSKLSGSFASGLGADNKVDQIKAGYVYNLSKRTALYTNVSRLKNGGLSNLSIAGGGSQTLPPTLGGKSTGAEVGIRTFF